MRVRLLANLLVAVGLPVQACSVVQGWKPPTPEEAFAAASIVVHARVLAQSGANTDDVVARVAVIRTWKGSFHRRTVRTGSGSLCGVNSFTVGEEYVFFLSSARSNFVSFTSQPSGYSTAQVLEALARLPR